MIQNENLCVSAEQLQLTKARIPGLFLKYAVPGVIGLLFIGIQTVIDGIFLSHFAGARALASVNLILPCYNFMIAIAIVIGIGCQAFIGIRLGQSEIKTANNALTSAFFFLAIFSSVVSILIFSSSRFLAGLLGADEILMEDAVRYIRALAPFLPALTLMFLGDYMLKVAGRPVFATCVMSGTVILNIILDFIFIGKLGWGVSGAGLATGIAFTAGAFCNVPVMFDRKQTLCIQRGHFKWRILGQMFYNGSSEGVSELSAGISIFMFNLILMKHFGADGVAAFTALGYVLFIGVTVFLGISDGVIPIISYNHGNQKPERVKATVFLGARTNLCIGILLFSILLVSGKWLMSLFFKSEETAVLDLAMQGAGIYAFAFLFNGLNILASGYFTAIGNAKISMIVSLSRGLIFITLGILILPRLFGIESIWYVIPIAEFCTFLISAGLFLRTTLHRPDPAK